MEICEFCFFFPLTDIFPEQIIVHEPLQDRKVMLVEPYCRLRMNDPKSQIPVTSNMESIITSKGRYESVLFIPLLLNILVLRDYNKKGTEYEENTERGALKAKLLMLLQVHTSNKNKKA